MTPLRLNEELRIGGEGEEGTMRDCNKIISIVVGKKQHERWEDFADEVTHGSVSQLVRWAVEQAIKRENGELHEGAVDPDYVQNIVEKFEKRFDRLEEKIEKLPSRLNSKTENNSKIEKVVGDVLSLLRETGEAMTIPQISGALPHDPEEVGKAIGILYDDGLLLKKIESDESIHQDGVPRWKAL